MDYVKDSIFKSTIRSFFKTFGGFLGFFIAIFVFSLMFIFASKSPNLSNVSRPVIKTDANGVRQALPSSAPVILRIPIHGMIGTRMLDTQTINTQLANSQGLSLAKGRVHGIILDIQSGGGTAIDSHNIFILLKEYKKKYEVPVFAYVDGMCASGAMMIACSADQIYSGPTGMIGSVGVRLGPLFNYSELMNKLGITQHTFIDGIDKDEMSPFRKWKPDEGKSIQEIIAYDYHLFVNLVTTHRPKMDKHELIHTYGAHVFDPITAMDHGYIDHIVPSYNEALEALVTASVIKGDYQVVELKPEFSLAHLSEGYHTFLTKNANSVKIELPMLPDFFMNNMGKPLYLYAPYLNE